MIYPPYLRSGDKVAIVAPAGRIESEDLSMAIPILESWGLEVEIGPHVFDKYNYFASNDSGRQLDMQKALDDPKIQAIFCARGGYGTGRIIDGLDFTQFLKSPKWVIGFSDITILHLKLHQLGVASLHGPVARQIGRNLDDESLKTLKRLLFEADEIEYMIPPNSLNIEGETSALITGGNLTLICNSMGTSTEIDLKGKILFTEEIDEKLYAFDRYLNQLLRAGKLKNLKAIIGGQFTGIKDTDTSFGKNAHEILNEYARESGVPLCLGMESGHENRNLTVPLSYNCDLNVNSTGSVIKFYRQ